MNPFSPFLPPNPLYPRPCGGAVAEEMKKQFLINNELYDLVSPGGVIQIDDYGHWAGAR